jgi:hypothetical protein
MVPAARTSATLYRMATLHTHSSTLKMEAAGSSIFNPEDGGSRFLQNGHIYRTKWNNVVGENAHSHCRENLKSNRNLSHI